MHERMSCRSLWPFGSDVDNEWVRSVFVKVPDRGTYRPNGQKDI